MVRALMTPVLCAIVLAAGATGAGAQQLLDRVVARVNGVPIMLTDINAAIGIGLADVPQTGDPVAAATVQMIDRQLMLAEVDRFSPPEPAASAVAAEVERLKRAAGARLPQVVQSTGLTDERLRELARETLQIQAYVTERFGTAVQVSDQEVEQYYRSHAAEFTRNGILMSFEDAAPVARTRASTQRRTEAVAQWLRDLRSRADVAMPRH